MDISGDINVADNGFVQLQAITVGGSLTVFRGALAETRDDSTTVITGGIFCPDSSDAVFGGQSCP